MPAATSLRDSSKLRPARFWDRAAALLIDGLLCFVIPLPIAGVFALLHEALFFPVAFALPIGYFTLGTLYGGTAGMRALGLRVVRAMFGFSDEPDAGYSRLDVTILIAMAVVLLGSIVVRLTMPFDPARRTLLDRLIGVAIVSRPEPTTADPADRSTMPKARTAHH
jgi:uncharacterized RDD family membrane protein YckC